MKIKGIFGVPAIDKETGKEYIQPIPNVVVVLRTDEGVEHTFEVDSFGYYSVDIPIGEYGVQAYVKGNKQTLGYLRQGVHFPVTESTVEGAFDEWLRIDTVNNPDPLLSQWTQLLKDIEKQRTLFANDINDVVGVIEREAEPVIQNAIARVQREADVVKVDVTDIITSSQESMDLYLNEKKAIYDADLAANIVTSNKHLDRVTVIKADIEKIQTDLNTQSTNYNNQLDALYLKHSKSLTDQKTTISTDLDTQKVTMTSDILDKLNTKYIEYNQNLEDSKISILATFEEDKVKHTNELDLATKGMVTQAKLDIESSVGTYLTSSKKEIEDTKVASITSINAHAQTIHESIQTKLNDSLVSLGESSTEVLNTFKVDAKEYSDSLLESFPTDSGLKEEDVKKVIEDSIVYIEEWNSEGFDKEVVNKGRVLSTQVLAVTISEFSERFTLIEENYLNLNNTKWDIQSTVGSGNIIRQTELDRKWDVQETVGNPSGKVMREGAYGIGGDALSGGSDISNINRSGIYRAFYKSPSFDYGHFLHMQYSSSFYTQIGVKSVAVSPPRVIFNHKGRGGEIYSGEFYTDINTYPDSNGVLYNSSNPIDTLNTSDMADTVVDNDLLTVTSGAVFRAINTSEGKINKTITDEIANIPKPDMSEYVLGTKHTTDIASINKTLDTKQDNLTFTGTGNVVRLSEITSLEESVDLKLDKSTYNKDKLTFFTVEASEALNTSLVELINTKADQNSLNTANTNIGKKADKTYTDTELGKKLNTATYNIDKATFSLKTDLSALETSLNTSIGKKADQTSLNTANTNIGKKLDKTVYDKDKATFSIKTEVTTAIDTAIGTLDTDLRKAIGVKADVTVTTNLKTEIDKRPLTTTMNTELGKKLNTATYNTDKATFATKTLVTDEIAKIPKVDLSSYATKAHVTTEIGKIPKVDLTPYALKSSLSAYATTSYVTTEIGKIPKPNMSNYPTKTEMNTAINAKGGGFHIGDLGTTNLNSYSTKAHAGQYGQSSNANVTTARNYPVAGQSGSLLVEWTGANAGVIQKYTTYTDGRFFIRTFQGNTWSAWKEFVSFKNANLVNVLASRAINTQYAVPAGEVRRVIIEGRVKSLVYIVQGQFPPSPAHVKVDLSFPIITMEFKGNIFKNNETSLIYKSKSLSGASGVIPRGDNQELSKLINNHHHKTYTPFKIDVILKPNSNYSMVVDKSGIDITKWEEM